MSERKEGWYWVKVFNNTPWKCLQWNGEWWFGRGMFFEPEIVGPYIPTPDESSNKRPSNCRNQLREEGKPSPKSGCKVCGSGGLTGCPYETKGVF